jgi:hypothetical protein
VNARTNTAAAASNHAPRTQPTAVSKTFILPWPLAMPVLPNRA